MDRRTFIEFMSKSGSALALSSFALPTLGNELKRLPIKSLDPSTADEVVLADGLSYDVLASWGDDLFQGKGHYGFNNDFTAWQFISEDPNEALLWVNHETVSPLFVDPEHYKIRNKTQIDKERPEVGGSILRIYRSEGTWKIDPESAYNRRIDGTTSIPLDWPEPIAGKRVVEGTLANCAGGRTPWGTFLSCEENYDSFYGETLFDPKTGKKEYQAGGYGWAAHYPENKPEHYGWVVEIEPKTGEAKKKVALGRFAHESATVVLSNDGYPVVYMGDDANDRCLYKFVSYEKDRLSKGTLYVANFEKNRWVPLSLSENADLEPYFEDETEVKVYCREAAQIAGGTPLDRPEDIEVDEDTGYVYVSLTNNKPKGNYHGSLMKIKEADNDPASESFEWETFKAGEESSFSCPDNLSFDLRGNLWLTTDISGSKIGMPPYTGHGNNSLFYIPLRGKHAGEVVRVASAPVDAEFTGPCFSPDGQTLFLCVQHPGERSKGPGEWTSHFPNGGDSIPRSSLIAIHGETMQELVS